MVNRHDEIPQSRQRQIQGIANDRAWGVYKVCPVEQEKHERIRELLEKDLGIRKTAQIAGSAPSTVQRVTREELD